MIMPPMILMNTTSKPAMASPRTNFEAPSMAPKKPPSSSSFCRRRRAPFSSIRPAARVASIANCLPRTGLRGERGGDFGDAAGAFGDDDEVHDDEDREDDNADHEVAAHHEIAEGLDHVAGGISAFMAAREDQARGSEVECQPQHRRDQQHG